jgi:hypothetical protein
MKEIKTNDGKRGGLLKGKPHYDKNGNSLGGIKAIVTDANGKPVELEGGEVIINKEASKIHWKQLSKINQSAGNGVAIGPPLGADEDPEEYKDGGRIIEFNPNHIPNKWVVQYAQKIKKENPEIWKLGGNIFGNEAFENLLRVSKRGHWLDSEEWMYIKWRSYVARHKQDFRIEGVVAMLKWCDKVDKGWAYMKDLIEENIEKIKSKSETTKTAKTKMQQGGEIEDLTKLRNLENYVLSNLDEIKSNRKTYGFIRISKITNPYDLSTLLGVDSRIFKNADIPYYAEFVADLLKSGKKMAEGGEVKQPSIEEISAVLLNHLKKYSKEVYGEDIDDYSFMIKTTKEGEKYQAKELSATTKSGQNIHITVEELYMERGGELSKGIKAEKEHQKTIDKIYNRKVPKSKAPELIAKDHLKEDKKYYSKLEKMEGKKFSGGGAVDDVLLDKEGNEVKIGDIGFLETRKGLVQIEVTNIRPNWVIFNDLEENKRKDNPRDKFSISFLLSDSTQTSTSSNSTIIDGVFEIMNEDIKFNSWEELTNTITQINSQISDKNLHWRLPTTIELETYFSKNRTTIPNLGIHYLSSEILIEPGTTNATKYLNFENNFKGQVWLNMTGMYNARLVRNIKQIQQTQTAKRKPGPRPTLKTTKISDLENLSERIDKLEPSYIPSTDPSTWNAEYKVGDVVRVRVDMEKNYVQNKPNGSPVKYSDEENKFVITQIDTSVAQPYKEDEDGNNVGGVMRKENPSGKVYILGTAENKQLYGGTWEGKDLELAFEIDKKQPQQPQQPQQQIKKPQKQVKTIEPEPIKRQFDSSKDYAEVFKNYFEKDMPSSRIVTEENKRRSIVENFILSSKDIAGFNEEKLQKIHSYIKGE